MHAHLMSTSDNHTSYSVAVVQFEFLFLVPAELSIMVQYVAIYVFLQQPASCFLSAPLALCISPGQPQDALDLWLNCPNPPKKKKKPDWLCSAPHCLFQMFPSCTSSLSNKTENLNKNQVSFDFSYPGNIVGKEEEQRWQILGFSGNFWQINKEDSVIH